MAWLPQPRHPCRMTWVKEASLLLCRRSPQVIAQHFIPPTNRGFSSGQTMTGKECLCDRRADQ